MGDETVAAQQKDQKQYLWKQQDMKNWGDYEAFIVGWWLDTDPICSSEEKQLSQKNAYSGVLF